MSFSLGKFRIRLYEENSGDQLKGQLNSAKPQHHCGDEQRKLRICVLKLRPALGRPSQPLQGSTSCYKTSLGV